MSLYHEIPFLRNVVLTDLISNIPVLGNLIGETLLPTREVPTREIEWEVILGGRNLAPIVAWDAQSPLVKHPGIERKAAECIDLREKYSIREADMLFLRNPGERESRAGRQIIADQLARMRTDVETSKEKMRWDAILTGEINTLDYAERFPGGQVDGMTLDMTIDFGIPDAMFVSLTGTARWNDSAPLPLNDFNNALKLVRERNGRRLKTAFMNTNTHLLLDKMEPLRADFRYVSGGDLLVKAGHITDVLQNVRIIDYDEGYKNDVNWDVAEPFKYFLPDNKVVFTVGTTDGGERYGDVANAPAVLADGSRVTGIAAEQWTSPDPTREYVRVVTVVMPRIFHPDWTFVLTVA
jgi:hypothetical protein